MTNTTESAPQQLTDVRDMYVVHRVFRREFAQIPRLIRSVAAGDIGRAAVVASHARLILLGLDLHHTGEDALLWPKLLERDAPHTDLIHRMEAQHDRVEELIAELTAALPRWEAEARPAVSEELASTFDALRVALLEHLADEEEHILPIAARCVTQDEWNALGEHGVAKMEKSQLPLMFGAMLEEATPEERTMMLALVPPPVRLLVRTVFAWQYRRYVTKVRAA